MHLFVVVETFYTDAVGENWQIADMCPSCYVGDPLLFMFVRILLVKLVSHFDLSFVFATWCFEGFGLYVVHYFVWVAKMQKVLCLCAKMQN